MKKLLAIGFVLILTIGLTACGDSTRKSSGKMSQEEGIEKMTKLTEQIQNGEITPEEFEKQTKELTKNTETTQEMMKRTNDYLSDFDGLPSWAKDLGMVEVEGLKLDQSRSDISKEDLEKHIPKSFMAYYNGDAESVLKEGKRLVETLKLKDNFNIEGSIIAGGEIDGYSVNVSVRTDIDKPFLSYSASEKPK